MGIALAGSSTQSGSSSADDDALLETIRVIVADGAHVFAKPSGARDRNTFVGRDIVADESAGNGNGNNTVIGHNVTIGAGVRDAVSIGRNSAALTESGAVHVGGALHYRGATGDLSLAGGSVRANSLAGTVALGRAANGGACLALSPAEARLATPLRFGDTDDAAGAAIGTGTWSIAVEPSEEPSTEPSNGSPNGDESQATEHARDLVLRAPGGQRIVFCGRK